MTTYTPMPEKRELLAVLGAILTLIFLVYAAIQLGPVLTMLGALWAGLAVMDALKGRVSVLMLGALVMLLAFQDAEFFLRLAVPSMLLFLFCWLVVCVLQKRKILDREKHAFGLGDVVGLPCALTLSWVLLPFWGLVIFTAYLPVLIPVFIKRKTLRLLPWITPPIVVTFVISVFV